MPSCEQEWDLVGIAACRHTAAAALSPSAPSSYTLLSSPHLLCPVYTQVLLSPSGVPVTSGCGAPVAITPEGAPLIGPGGLPCCLGPDGDTLLTWDGKTLLGPQVRTTAALLLLGGPGLHGFQSRLFLIRTSGWTHQPASS